MDIGFEWDEAKAEANFRKHGVDFIDAAQIFAGPVFQAADSRFDYGEPRMRAIGEHDGETYVVVFTRRADALRLISAWKAGRNDRRRYREALAQRP